MEVGEFESQGEVGAGDAGGGQVLGDKLALREDGVMFGGQAGVADHLTLGRGARIAAAASVLADVPSGETVSGFPARPLRQFLRETIWLSKQAASRKTRREE